jgi:hypothetical protein
MTTGYSIEILSKTELTTEQKANLLAKCKSELIIEHNDFDVVIANLILAKAKEVETLTSNFLSIRQVKVNVKTVKGILDLPYSPALRSPAPTFSDSQVVVWDSGNSLYAFSDVPISVTYSAGYSVIPEDLETYIIQSIRVHFDTEKGALNHLQKIDAIQGLRDLYLTKNRINALISSYV